MTLRVLIGSANAGKTGVIHDQLRACIDGGSAAALLLPSMPDVSRALAELAPEVPLGLTVTTFDAFLDALWADLEPGTSIVGATRRLCLLADIGSSAPLEALADSASSPGFTGALAAFVERAAGSPTSVAKLGPAAREIVALLRAYEERLASDGLIERVAAHRRVAAAVSTLHLPDLIAVNRFTGFTAAQEAFIVAVGQRQEALVALTYDPDVPATSAASAEVARLVAAGAEVVPVPPGGGHTAAPELVRLERALGSDRPTEVAAAGAVVLSEAWGEAAEAARIAREVQDALVSGFAPEQIAVAFRDPARHVRALRAAFDEAQIDADVDVRVRFDATGLGRVLLLLLGYFGGMREPAEIMDALRSPYVPAPADALNALDVRLRATREMTPSAFERACASAGGQTAAFLAQARAASRALGGPDAERQWWRIVTGMLGRARPGAPLLDLDGLMDAAAARTFMEAVTESSATGGRRGSATDLATALRAAWVTVASPDRSGHVQVMSVERLRGRRYRCVVLGGLTDGEFPRRAREDAFGSPGVRDDLERAGIDATPRDTLEQERLLFYQAVTRARERLVLSWQSHDADGRPLRPSIFLEELLDLYRDPGTSAWIDGEPPHRALGLHEATDPTAAPQSERRALRHAAAAGTDGTTAEARARLAHARYRSRPRGACLGEAVRAALATREAFSATDIEAYLQCPFRWYVERVLRPAEIDVELDAAASGRLGHEILRCAYDEYTALTGKQRIVPETLGHALEAHARAAEAAVRRTRVVGAAEAASVRAVVRNTAQTLTDDATMLPGFEPRYREWSFGLEEGDPAEDFGEFSLVGRIDRIDTDGERAVVTDYKSGTVSSERSCNAFEKHGLVQLPLYAAVASRRLGLEAAGGVYRGLRSRRPRGFVRADVVSEATSREVAFVSTDEVKADEIDSLIERAVARAREAVAGMRAGEIPARVPSDGCPRYCGARAVCTVRGGLR